MLMKRRNFLASVAALASSLPAYGQSILSYGVSSGGGGGGGGGGAPSPTFLATLAGPAAGTLNMLPWSAYASFSDFSAAAYTKTRSSINTTNISAPDSSATGQHLAEDNSTNTHLVGGTFGNPFPTTVSLSFIPVRVAVIAKAAERTRMVVEWVDAFTDPSGTGVTIGFDLAGGNTGYDNSVGIHQTLLAGPTMTSLGNGWWLCRFDVMRNVFVATSGGTNWAPAIYIDAGAGTAARNLNYAGNGTSGINLWWFNAMPVQAWNITQQVFYDDFNSLSTIDLANTKAPGFKWYIASAWPNAVPQSFWNGPGQGVSFASNFTISSPSVLKIFNPNPNQTGLFSTILNSAVSDGANGYVGNVFSHGNCVMTDCSVAMVNTPGGISPNWAGTPTLWQPSIESQSNNGLSATFQFREFNTFETGSGSVAVGEDGELSNTADHETPHFLKIGQSGFGMLNPGNVFHRISGLWITAAANGFGWGCVLGFGDGQLVNQGVGSYNATTGPNAQINNTTPGIGSQTEWHHFLLQLATGENVTGNPGGGWPLFVDWVKCYANPSAPVPHPTWNYFDQPTGGFANPIVGALVLTQNNNANDGLTVTKTSADAAWDMIRCGMGKGAGKWYWEIKVQGTLSSGNTSPILGIVNATKAVIATGDFPGSFAGGAGAQNGSNWNLLVVAPAVAAFSGTVSMANNDVFGFALDADLGKMYIHRNGTWVSGTPASGNAVWTGLTTANPGVNAAGWYPACGINGANDGTAIANFGQSAFAFAVPAGYNSGLF